MKSTILFTISVLSFSFIAGCGSSSSDANDELQNEITIIEYKTVESIEGDVIESEDDTVPDSSDLSPLLLEGTWVQGCIDGNLKSYKNQLIYESSNIKIQSDTYSNIECESMFSRSEINANFEFGEDIELATGEMVNKINYVVNSVEVTYFDDEVISDFNQEQLCGVNDWSVGEFKDVSNCDAFKSLWSIERDIFMIEGEMLSIGDLSTIGDGGFPEQLSDSAFIFREPAHIEGEWLKGCTGRNGNQSVKEPVIYTDQNIYRRLDSFSDIACELMDYSFEYSGTYIIGQETVLNSGLIVNELDISYNSVKLAFHSDFYLMYFNDVSYCGFSNWAKGEFKDVTICESYSETLDLKEIFYIEDDNLFIGSSNNPDNENYPESIDDGYYTRQ